jgi:hypothetical protein
MQWRFTANQAVTAEIPYTVDSGAKLVKVFDSEKDGCARFTPHTSFEDPQSPPAAPPRQSIEARALAFFAT